MNTGTEPESLGHWSLDLHTMELQASPACRRNHGRKSHEESTYEQIVASIHHDDRERVRKALRRAFEEGEDYEEQYRTILPSGEVRNILARGRLQQPQSGGAPRLAGTTLDVTGGVSGRGEPEQAILEAAGEGIYGLDASGRVTFVNPAAQRMSGREAVEMIGKRMHDEIHHSRPGGGPYPASECPIYETLRDGTVHHAEDEVFWRADGESFPVRYTATPIVEDGQVSGAVVTFSDITGRKQAEEALRESEERFRAFVAASSDVVYKMSADWSQMQNLVGKQFIADTENPRTDWTEHYIPEEDKPIVWAAIEEAIENKSNFELEHRVIRVDGTKGWTYSRAVPMLDEAGGIVEWLGTASDITERKRTEEALLEAEQRYRTLFESMDEGYAVVEALADEDGVWDDFLFIEVNPAFEKQTGISDPVARTGSELLGDPDPGWARIYGRVAETGEPERVEQEEATLGRIFDLYAFRLGGAGSRRVAVLFTDITERKRAEEGLRDREERLHLATEAAEVGIWELDLHTNESPVRSERHDRIFGYDEPVESWSFEIFLDHVHPDDRERVRTSFDEALRKGAWEFECRIIRANDGEQRWISAQGKFYYERDERGNEPRRAVGTVQDITSRRRVEAEREQARRRTEFLAEASTRLSDSLDWEQTLSEIARLAVPGICDLCIVDTLDAPGEDSSVRRLAAAHHDHEKERLAWELEERYPVHGDRSSGIAEVLRTGRSTLITKVDDEWLDYISQDESHRRILEGLGLGSIAIVPLVTHGRILGALTLASDGSGRRYDREDLALAEDLARRAAQSMDNARLYEEQSHAARTLQQSLLPPSLPEIAGMEAAACFRPATSEAGAASGGYNVGGDFYDMFQTPAGWAVVVGDVMGKGVEAAELTAMVRYTLRTAAMSGDSPSGVISTLNAAMLNQRSDMRFCTLAYGLLNEAREEGTRLTLCRGGHPPPIIMRAGGTVEEAGTRGLLVGVEPDPVWSDTVVELAEGDGVIFYTDGLTEARNPEGRLFGAQRLKDLAADCSNLGARQTADALERGVVEFQEGESARDDVALLVIRATGEDQPQ